MDQTFNTKAIVIKRYPFRENDSQVIVYSEDRGKMELVARGTRKISSKLAVHLEPFSFCELMVVKGRSFSYVGGVSSSARWKGLFSDWEYLQAAGSGMRMLDSLTRPGISDGRIFSLLEDFLEVLSGKECDARRIEALFSFRLMSFLGYSPVLRNCVNCGRKISQKSFFDASVGGLNCCNPGKYSQSLEKEEIEAIAHVLENGFEGLPVLNGSGLGRAADLFRKYCAA